MLVVSEENENHARGIKAILDMKISEAQNQLKSIEYNLKVEFLSLKNSHEKTLNDCKGLEKEMQQKVIDWQKKMNSTEYRRNSSKLQRYCGTFILCRKPIPLIMAFIFRDL